MSAAHRITLNDGRQIPFIGFGTGTALYQKDAENSVKLALACGVVHLDGAQLYQNEDSLGDAVVASGVPRASLFVTTKLGKVPEGKTVRDTLVESLKKLKMDYVDLFLIHMPIHHAGRLAQVWKEFEAIQKEGLARSIGVSNFRVKDYEELMQGATVTPAVNQVREHSTGCRVQICAERRRVRLSTTRTCTSGASPSLSTTRSTASSPSRTAACPPSSAIGAGPSTPSSRRSGRGWRRIQAKR